MTTTAPQPSKDRDTRNRAATREATTRKRRRSWLPPVLGVGSLALFVGLLRRRGQQETAPADGLVTFVPPRKPGRRYTGRDAWADVAARASIRARTLRTDTWWLQPLITVLALLVFIVYSTWRAFQGAYYFAEPYISPFYSPCITTACEGNTFPKWIVAPAAVSPAIYILIIPLGFRLTCYYYRKAYYRSFWMSPPACAVAEPHKRYSGETRFPLILQNIHRYFFYLGLIYNAILTYDAVLAFRDGQGRWGHMGLGTLILLINAALLWLYSVSCHSCRHVMGGRLNHFSRHPVRYRLWTGISRLNTRHSTFAWISLFFVAWTDAYIFLIATGHIADPRFF